MNTLGVETTACVVLLMFAGITFQGCGAPGEPIEVDGVNSGDPCSVCKDPESQGPDAGDLNNGDFTVFCNSPKCKPGGTDGAAETVKNDNAEVHATDSSPPLCEVCNRPDTQGHYAGELNDDDFIVQCTKECPGFQHPGPSMQMAAQQKNAMGGLSFFTCAFFLFMASLASLALKRFVVKKESFLPCYDEQSDAQYVRVVG